MKNNHNYSSVVIIFRICAYRIDKYCDIRDCPSWNQFTHPGKLINSKPVLFLLISTRQLSRPDLSSVHDLLAQEDYLLMIERTREILSVLVLFSF